MDKFNEYEKREVQNFFLMSEEPSSRLLSSEDSRKEKEIRKLTIPKKTRVRSAERDKRTEFQARYWAFLFGNLQRAIDEIYRIVEYYENLESCQEAILVLENYIREFRALAEFFKMSWDYEKTPQRQSIAWEVRKTNTAPRLRNRNITSPGLSEKSSPSYSGANSPCPTIEEHIPSSSQSKSLKKNNSKVDSSMISKIVTSNEKKFEQLLKESSPLEEKDRENLTPLKPKSISLEDLNTSADLSFLIIKSETATQTEGLVDDNLTLQEYLLKYTNAEEITVESTVKVNELKSDGVNLQAMEENNEQQPLVLNDVPPFSEIVKPQRSFKGSSLAVPLAAATKVFTKSVIKANYSLRNQTINNKIQKPSEVNVTRKSTAYNTSQPRQSRPQVRIHSANIPSAEQSSKVPPQIEALIVRSKTMIELPKNQPRTNKAGELRKKKSIEDNNNTDSSSSSTLKASNEGLGSKGNLKNAEKKVDNSSSKLNDGEWRTVKTKRRSSWISNRFDQPSASTSLPALALISLEESDKEQSNQKEEAFQKNLQKNACFKATKQTPTSKTLAENKKEIVKSKADAMLKQTVQKSKTIPTTSYSVANNKKMASVKAKVNSNVPKRAILAEKSKPLANKQNLVNQQTIIRQKSDITGLKIKSLHKEFLRNEKTTPVKKKKGTSNDQKVDMKLQTSQILISKTIDKLYSELGPKRITFVNGGEIGENLSSCDEVEERDLESDDDQKKLVEEQENLERQIRELEEKCDLDEIDTDCEAILCDLDDNESSNDTDSVKDPFIDESMTLEMRYAPILREMSNHEREETLATLQTLLEREPGRAMKLHQKLSSPSRRRSVRETLKKYQAKHFKAHEKRTTIQKERAQKIQQLIQRVEQVKAAREQLTDRRRLKMEERLQRATENRENFLKNKVKKAHDEEEKLKEIAFIKNLEMQNKMMDFIESCKEQEGRLSSMEVER